MQSREKKPSPTHQNTDTSFPNQETVTSYLFNPIHREEPPQLRGIINHKNTEKPPQTQQSKQDEKAEKYSAGKETPNQRKEEKIVSLPENGFRIMIVKRIINLENKMELQINSLETRVEKM